MKYYKDWRPIAFGYLVLVIICACLIAYVLGLPLKKEVWGKPSSNLATTSQASEPRPPHIVTESAQTLVNITSLIH